MNSIPDSMLRALGWALAHSLWQGALLAIALLVLLPRLQTARQRYWAAYAALIAVFAAAIGTFLWKFEPAPEWAAGTETAAENLAGGGFFRDIQTAYPSNWGESFTQWLETNHALIVAVWLLGFVFFLLRLGVGLWQVHRLRTRGVQALSGNWQEKILELSAKLGVSSAVQVLESTAVHAPIALGWLKPLVLLPLGFVNQLPIAEVEAVLAHELAHIARRDWVFNLLQAFIESLFYYHPAVWWVSQVIRRERENACDDAALAATGNPLAFARALVQVQEMATPLPVLALALSGKRRRPLLERVRRILNQTPQQQHQVMEKITATIILLALLALVGLRANSGPSIGAAFAQIADMPAAIFGLSEQEPGMDADSLPKPKSTRKITREEDNQKVEAEYQDGKLTRLNIDGKEIPESDFEQHEALIEELEGDAPAPPSPPRAFWHGPEGRFGAAPAAPAPPGAPDAPHSFWFSTPTPFGAAPMPPLPPLPALGNGISIVTDKDEDGNTLIKLDNHGEETELIVKNGEVWIDGKKMEKGESLDIPGLNFLEGLDGSAFSFGDGDFVWGDVTPHPYGISPEEQEQLNQEMELARKEHRRAMEEHRRNFEREKKQLDLEWKLQQKELEKEGKRRQKDQENWKRKQEAWEEQHQKLRAEQKAMEAQSKAAQELIKQELLRDGLISTPDKFTMQINPKTLKVNNKKQSEEMRKKYEKLVKEAMGKNFEGDNWNYNFNFNNEE